MEHKDRIAASRESRNVKSYSVDLPKQLIERIRAFSKASRHSQADLGEAAYEIVLRLSPALITELLIGQKQYDTLAAAFQCPASSAGSSQPPTAEETAQAVRDVLGREAASARREHG